MGGLNIPREPSIQVTLPLDEDTQPPLEDIHLPLVNTQPPLEDTQLLEDTLRLTFGDFIEENPWQKGLEIKQTLQLDIINTLPLNELSKDKNIELQGVEIGPQNSTQGQCELYFKIFQIESTCASYIPPLHVLG